MPNSRTSAASSARQISKTTSVLAWPAWMRAVAVLPILGLLWLGVAWALVDVVPL